MQVEDCNLLAPPASRILLVPSALRLPGSARGTEVAAAQQRQGESLPSSSLLSCQGAAQAVQTEQPASRSWQHT